MMRSLIQDIITISRIMSVYDRELLIESVQQIRIDTLADIRFDISLIYSLNSR